MLNKEKMSFDKIDTSNVTHNDKRNDYEIV